MARRKPSGAVQLNLPGTCRVDKVARSPKLTESALQEQTLRTLSLLGYAALEAGKARKKVVCPCCDHSFYPEGWQGNTVGYPDVAFFRYSPLFPPIGIFVEMKGETTKVRKEQQDLADAGRSVIAYSTGDAVRAVLAAETAMDQYRFSDQKRGQIELLLQNSTNQLK